MLAGKNSSAFEVFCFFDLKLITAYFILKILFFKTNCNQGPDSDKEGFSALVTELRESFDKYNYLLSAAVSPSKLIIDKGELEKRHTYIYCSTGMRII